MKTQRGFAIFELVAVVAIITLVGFLGYTAYSRYETQVASKKDTSQQLAAVKKVEETTVATAPTIEQTADLDKADSAIDTLNIDDVEDDEGTLNATLKEVEQ